MRSTFQFAQKMKLSTIAVNKAPSVFNDAKTTSVYKKLKVGPMKRLYQYYTPTSVNLAGGVPMDSCFPFESLQVNLPNNDSYKLDRSTTLAINYQRGDGMPVLKEWIKTHTSNVHSPPNTFGSCVTVGSTDALSKILTLLNCDSLIFDEFAYGHAVITSETLNKKPIGVIMDENGMVPSALRSTVTKARANGLSANVLYLVPCGHNPTGLTMSLQRKQEIYAVCQELDIVIIEDDAYYYLNYDVEGSDSTGTAELPGIKNLPKTLLSLDVDGRVLRLDSLSKFMAPGMRLGWLTAPQDFVDKYQLLQEISTQFPSGFSQSVFNGLVQHWGEGKLHAHAQKIQEHYRSQRDVTTEAIKTYFKPGVVTFVNPSCGMFVWLTFHVDRTPFELFQLFAAAGVITVPGNDFHVPGLDAGTSSSSGSSKVRTGTAAVRLTFAASSPEQIRKAIKAMADCLETI